ncbi:MAG: indolepyruvate oxidoreductase subunit beta [Victivallaceae bacterium]|nr:indolepyruvate oxidoreductase subunit beta [Victivallaceae bacterium]
MKTSKVMNVLMVGVGGQGIITAGNMLSLAAMNAGYDVKKSEIHGMSQRGGSVFCHVRFGEKVASPVIPVGEADILVSLEEMETLRWLDFPAPGGKVICLKNRILPHGVENYPEDTATELKKHGLDYMELLPADLTAATGSAKTVNVAVLGIVAGFLDIPEDAWKKAVAELAPAGTADLNLYAFEQGRKTTIGE